MASRPDRAARSVDKAAVAAIASYQGDWTVLLDDSSRIVYELGTRDLVLGGATSTSSIGRRIAAFVHPDDIGLAMDRMEDSLATSGSDIAFEIRAGDQDGSWRTVTVRAVNLLDDEVVRGIVLAVRPIH